MKKLMVKLIAVCLVVLLLPVSAFAEYTLPDYAVTLNGSADKIYEGEEVVISFSINSEDFLMADMTVSYDPDYFTDDSGVDGKVTFYGPEIKGTDGTDGNGSYDLKTNFTFKAGEVTDTIKVPFEFAAADIVYNFESAAAGEDTNVTNRTNTSVIIVKQYDVTFAQENGNVLSEQKVDKGLDNESDTAITAPVVDYVALGYIEDGLVADYYEHVWTYNGNEYTDEEIAAFGQTGSSNEIKKDTTFVLEVRKQTFNVTVDEDVFDTEKTPDTATYGEDYTGKINPDEYDDKYDYTVKYEIGGIEKEVECVEDSFTIPGENIIGDMVLSVEKELNIVINAYAEYLTGYFLITVDGAAAGYTFNGFDMYQSENHNNLRAWIYKPQSLPMTEEEVESEVVEYIATTTKASPVAPTTYDINGKDGVDINDAALVYGAYMLIIVVECNGILRFTARHERCERHC